jgi:histidine triad (HIT) family protein
MADCLFCRIVKRQIPAAVVHETETTLAFRDINPKAPVHVLVIPKEHIENFIHVEKRHVALIGDIHETIREVARMEKVETTGFRVIVNNGPDAGQAVSHLHYHVLGQRPLGWPPG